MSNPQRVLLLDWTGTLSVLDNPVAFIQACKDQGDYVVLKSFGGYPVEVRDAVDLQRSKMQDYREFMDDLNYRRVTPTEVLVVDDDQLTLDVVKRKAEGLMTRFGSVGLGSTLRTS